MSIKVEFYNEFKPIYHENTKYPGTNEQVIKDVELENLMSTIKFNNLEECKKHLKDCLEKAPEDYNPEYDKFNNNKFYVKIKFDNGSTYEGQINKDGKCEGIGKITFEDGNIYIGVWREGKREGKGVMEYNDGSKYEGEWEDDKRNGYGTHKLRNGNKYIGLWQNGDKYGLGRYYFKYNNDKNILLTGCYYDDPAIDDNSFHPLHLILNKNRVYDIKAKNIKIIETDGGTLCNIKGQNIIDNINALFLLNLISKKKLVPLTTDKPTVCTFDNNVIYEGTLKNGKFNGNGRLLWPGGKQKYIGTFKDGICDNGVLIINDYSIDGKKKYTNIKLKQEEIDKITQEELLRRSPNNRNPIIILDSSNKIDFNNCPCPCNCSYF